jgi:ubiquinone biosynthesis protein
VISALSHITRLARAGIVFAREGVFGAVDPALIPPPALLAVKIARLIERKNAQTGPKLSRALTRLGPAYRHGARSRKSAGPAAAVFAH